jgi:hypothetical protein
MAEIKWILTCSMECREPGRVVAANLRDFCPHDCPYSTYEKEQLNTEVPNESP